MRATTWMSWVWLIALAIWASLGVKASLESEMALTAAYKEELNSISAENSRYQDLLSKIFQRPVTDPTTQTIKVTATAYHANEQECDKTPEVTANNTPSRVGLLAVSRDLLTDVGLSMGQRVVLPNYGLFIVCDVMNKRYKRRVDILHANPEAANLFGVQEDVDLLFLNSI